MNDIRSSVYDQKVELLLRLIPIVMEERFLPYMVVQWKLLNLKKLAK